MKKVITLLLLLVLVLRIFAIDYSYNSDGSIGFAWMKGDKAGLYTLSGTLAPLKARAAEESDSHYRQFATAGASIYSGEQYYFFYPYNSDYVSNLVDLPISYLGQTQIGNGNMAHLGAYDFMSSSTILTSPADAIRFHHLNSIIRIKISVNVAVAVESVTISSSETPFVATAKLNYKDGTMTATSKAETVTLDLNETVVSDVESLVAYMMIAPDDHSSSVFTVTINTSDGQTASETFRGVNMEAGMVYPINMKVSSLAKASAMVGNSEIGNGDSEPSLAKNSNITAGPIVTYPLCYAPDFKPGANVPTSIKKLASSKNESDCFDISGKRVSKNTNLNHTVVVCGGKKVMR